MCFALEKGRADDPAVLNICRRWGALSSACNIRTRVRWLPSELNPSDQDSRRWEYMCRPVPGGKEVRTTPLLASGARASPSANNFTLLREHVCHPVPGGKGARATPLRASDARASQSANNFVLLGDASRRKARVQPPSASPKREGHKNSGHYNQDPGLKKR